MGDKGDLPHRGRRRLQEGSIHGQVGIYDPDAVRPKQAHPGIPGDAQAFLFQGSAFSAYLAEPAGNDDGSLHPTGGAIPEYTRHLRCGGQDDRQVDRIGHLGNGLVHRPSEQLATPGVDQVNRAGVTTLNQVARQAIPQFGRVLRNADERYAARVKERCQGRIHRYYSLRSEFS